jgi:XcyI restriction endonuclease
MPEPLRPPSAERQISFHQLLLGARTNWLLPALREALGKVDQAQVGAELSTFAPSDARRVLAAAGIRDEFVFPVPSIIHESPKLVGYYRLLLGRPQKSFYGSDGFGVFKSAERSGNLSDRQRAILDDFCRAMGEALAELVRGIAPVVTMQDIEELPIVTIGSQFQGSNNNVIGQQATGAVFLAVLELVDDDAIIEQSESKATIRNSAGRKVRIELASDPDVGVSEEVGDGALLKRVAIEIKGGTDRSNAHNRAGEAEKSHLKARAAGYTDCWTVISVHGVNFDRLRTESPSTASWFDINELLARQGESWDDFRHRLAVVVGIPIA